MGQGDGLPVDGASPATYRDDVRREWEAIADGWRRWEPFFASTTWPVTLQLMTSLRLRPGMRVLDFGGGIGDPGLSVASVVGPGGHVLSLDLSPQMVDIARGRARLLGLRHAEFRVGAVEDLDAAAGPFDAVVSRFTINFLHDLDGGLVRLMGLLRPGGRIAVSTWASPDENPMFRIPRDELARFIDARRQPPRNLPGPLRLSGPGELADVLVRAGFEAVDTVDVMLYNFARDVEEYVCMLYETAPMFQRAFNSLSGDQQRRVREGIMAAVAKYDDGGVIRVPAVARVASGAKPGAYRPSA